MAAFITNFFSFISNEVQSFFAPHLPVEHNAAGREEPPTPTHVTAHEHQPSPAPVYMLSPRLSKLYAYDFEYLIRYKEDVISGYLNLGQAEGWPEGATHELGASFTRYILFKFLLQHHADAVHDKVIIRAALKAFGSTWVQQDPAPYPRESRVRCDVSISGWQHHSVSRLVGNVGSAYNPSKPFFEILINSARGSSEEKTCHPFCVSIYKNREAIEERRRILFAMRQLPSSTAHPMFYSCSLWKPASCLGSCQDKLGPISSRLLKALIFLENVELPTQTVGNCWIKQPMRSLLAVLYLEIITHHPSLSFAMAWERALDLYQHIQGKIAIPLIKDLIAQSNAALDLKKQALAVLDVRSARHARAR